MQKNLIWIQIDDELLKKCYKGRINVIEKKNKESLEKIDLSPLLMENCQEK